MTSPKIEIQKYIVTKNSSIPATILNPFLALRPDHAVRAILSRGLRDGTLSADSVMLHYLNRLETEDDLFAMSIALRNGANPNLYVVVGGVNMHILAYLYKNWNTKFRNAAIKDDRLTITVLCLVAMGSNPTLPAIDARAGSVPSLPMARPASENVLQWLNTGGGRGLPHILDRVYPDITKNVDPPTMKRVAILTGKLDLLGGQKLVERDFELAIAAVTEPKIYPLLPLPVQMKDLDFKYMYDALLAFNEELAEFYVSQGILFSYPLFNNIILKTRQYKIEGSVLFYTMFARLIRVAIGRGQTIDNEQLNLLLILEKEDYDTIIASYDKPYWQKVCSSSSMYNDRVPKHLQDIAHHTGLEATNDSAYICEQLYRLSEIPTDKLEAAAKQRQRIRISGSHSTLPELIDTTEIPMLTCHNANQIEGDPLDYTELSMSHYRGADGLLWCFTSDKYSILSESKTNPATGLRLPDRFVELINYKIRRYKELGFDMRQPYRFSTIIQTTMKNDVVGDDESILQYDMMLDYLGDYGVGKHNLDAIKKEDLDAVMKSMGIHANLTLLETHTHVLYTLAYIINGLAKSDPGRAKVLAEKIAELIKRTTTKSPERQLVYFPVSERPPSPPQPMSSSRQGWEYTMPTTSTQFGVGIPYATPPPMRPYQPVTGLRTIRH